MIQRKTAAKRLRRRLHAITDWVRRHRHTGMAEQFATLVGRLLGHDAY